MINECLVNKLKGKTNIIIIKVYLYLLQNLNLPASSNIYKRSAQCFFGQWAKILSSF